VFLALVSPGGDGYDQRRGALRSYLYGVARNQVGKRLERTREVPFDLPAHAGASAPDSHGVEAARGEDVAAIREALAALPVVFREVVVLCELEGLSYEEAAGVCGVPVGTIRSRLSRARAQLMVSLGGTPPQVERSHGP
jgi:RNA polymerase sigma-70 factor (ECF subfamily)